MEGNNDNSRIIRTADGAEDALSAIKPGEPGARWDLIAGLVFAVAVAAGSIATTFTSPADFVLAASGAASALLSSSADAPAPSKLESDAAPTIELAANTEPDVIDAALPLAAPRAASTITPPRISLDFGPNGEGISFEITKVKELWNPEAVERALCAFSAECERVQSLDMADADALRDLARVVHTVRSAATRPVFVQ